MNGYEELANAIIVQAAKDYREALRLLGMNPNDKNRHNTINGVSSVSFVRNGSVSLQT